MSRGSWRWRAFASISRWREGGLDVARSHAHLAPYVEKLKAAGCRVSLFIDPERAQLDASAALGAPAVELHTGTYCDLPPGPAREEELKRLHDATEHAAACGLECHAGHGLTLETVEAVARIPSIVELNIGHSLIGEAVFCGLKESIRQMRNLMDRARGSETATKVGRE
jgi:pyridoxine 5-phosphate synthase